MDTHSNMPVSDRPCPMMFIVGPTFLCALAWLYVMLHSIRP
jgi:hypothetical protein